MSTPSDRAHASRGGLNAVYDRARAAEVRLVRVAYCDNANLIRAKAAPLDAQAASNRVAGIPTIPIPAATYGARWFCPTKDGPAKLPK